VKTLAIERMLKMQFGIARIETIKNPVVFGYGSKNLQKSQRFASKPRIHGNKFQIMSKSESPMNSFLENSSQGRFQEKV